MQVPAPIDVSLRAVTAREWRSVDHCRGEVRSAFGKGWLMPPDGGLLSVGLTDQTLSCTAKAHVPKPERHDMRLHVRRAMRVACRRDDFDFTRRLGRRAEAGPCQLLRRVRPPPYCQNISDAP